MPPVVLGDRRALDGAGLAGRRLPGGATGARATARYGCPVGVDPLEPRSAGRALPNARSHPGQGASLLAASLGRAASVARTASRSRGTGSLALPARTSAARTTGARTTGAALARAPRAALALTTRATLARATWPPEPRRGKGRPPACAPPPARSCCTRSTSSSIWRSICSISSALRPSAAPGSVASRARWFSASPRRSRRSASRRAFLGRQPRPRLTHGSHELGRQRRIGAIPLEALQAPAEGALEQLGHRLRQLPCQRSGLGPVVEKLAPPEEAPRQARVAFALGGTRRFLEGVASPRAVHGLPARGGTLDGPIESALIPQCQGTRELGLVLRERIDRRVSRALLRTGFRAPRPLHPFADALESVEGIGGARDRGAAPHEAPGRRKPRPRALPSRPGRAPAPAAARCARGPGRRPASRDRWAAEPRGQVRARQTLPPRGSRRAAARGGAVTRGAAERRAARRREEPPGRQRPPARRSARARGPRGPAPRRTRRRHRRPGADRRRGRGPPRRGGARRPRSSRGSGGEKGHGEEWPARRGGGQHTQEKGHPAHEGEDESRQAEGCTPGQGALHGAQKSRQSVHDGPPSP